MATFTADSTDALLAQAKDKLARGTLTAADLDELAVSARPRPLRQRLLYLHATTPSIASPLVAATLHEPRPGGASQMDPMQKDPEYGSVHEAICDGWQVIHFPLQAAPFDDREIDILGYEFVLQKLEPIDDHDLSRPRAARRA